MSRLPVRSPLPKSVPSTRSAPASKPSSVAATPVPRSLCVCRLMIGDSRSRHVAAHPFDLVRVNVRHRHLDGVRQIQDHLPLRRRLPDVHDGFADLHRELHLGRGEAFRRILQASTSVPDQARQTRSLTHCAPRDGDLHDLRLLEAEDHAALRGRRGVVEMDDDALRARSATRRCARSDPRAPAPAPGW